MTKQTLRPGSRDPKTNRFLAKLESVDYDAVMLKAKIVSLKLQKRLILQDDRIKNVYFPLTCMISLLVTADGKPQMEMATIGKEGTIGAAEIMQGQGALGLNLIQIPGTAVQIEATIFRDLALSRPPILRLIYQHQYALMRQILQGAACNRLHIMEERCARWLLMTHDRADEDTFPLTQEFLAHMLGVRRATVNVATGILKKAGFIRCVRGKLTVLDRPGLESASCDCYHAIVKVYNTLLPGAPEA
jgi:CRP-like cAMP-binding protein